MKFQHVLIVLFLKSALPEDVTRKEEIPEDKIYSMQILTNITNRFARTLIISGVRNLSNFSQEANFSVILPENAFISEFEMEIKGQVYKAHVEEKGKAEEKYKQAKSQGQSAAHVKILARDSKKFGISVNIEPKGKAIFRLLYEELLQRQMGLYELVININPEQIVKELKVEVHINESKPLGSVKTPSLRSGNEIIPQDENLNPSATINMIGKNSATVIFNPDVNQQKKFAKSLKGNENEGFSGQFVVQYDVERDPRGGEVLIQDGYFVHFFAPSSLQPLPKHVVFVLDHSGSMRGRKFDQLVDAMQNILSDMKPEDLFDIVRFNDEASVWNPETDLFSSLKFEKPKYGELEGLLKKLNISDAPKATEANIEKAKRIIRDNFLMTSTNIISGLEVALFLIKRTQEATILDNYQPVVLFLTDGLPNTGISSQEEIVRIVSVLNADIKAPIFSLSLGIDADRIFLRELSSKNLGISRHIYEASDVSIQLQNFYQTISSPLLSNITFKYIDPVSNVTATNYPILFKGSELVVAGRISDDPEVSVQVQGVGVQGYLTFNATVGRAVGSLERLWAYLTVKKLLKFSNDNTNESRKSALELALKYSFVTPVSSLVVVKPNEKDSVSSDSSRSSGGPPKASLANHNSNRRRGRTQPHKNSRLIRIHVKDEYILLLPRNINESTFENVTLPVWLEHLWRHNDTITDYNAIFKLSETEDVILTDSCRNDWAGLDGYCISVFDCPQLFPAIKDILVYTLQACPLNKYSGICCPLK